MHRGIQRSEALALQRAAGNEAVSAMLQRIAADHVTAAGGATLMASRFVGDAVLEACFRDKRRLGQGASGPAVEKVQGALIDLGYDLGSARPDGRYGARTAQAVRAFKKKESLGFEQFGDVGPGTMRRLDEFFREVPDPGPVPITDKALADDRVAAGPDPFVDLPLAPATALTVPPDEVECPDDPDVVAVGLDAGPSVAAGPVKDGVGDKRCDGPPSPPGFLSDFEVDLRNNPDRILGVIIDPENDNEIIGYRIRSDRSVLQVVDREGNFAGGNEAGLETPPIDPIDFVPTPGAVVKGATVAGKVGLKALGKFVAKGGTKKGWQISAAVIPNLRRISRQLISRRAEAAARRARLLPGILKNIRLTIPEHRIGHTFFEKASQWFGRRVTEADRPAWRAVIEQAHGSGGRLFPWTSRADKTIARLVRIDNKPFVIEYFEATGELATAFKPTDNQLKQIASLLNFMK